MPPRVPEEFLRSGHQTTNRCAFKFGMKTVGNDEQPGDSTALLNDAERITTVQQHRSHYCDVELSECIRQIVDVAIIHLRLGAMSGVTEPVRVLQLLHH